MKLLILGGTKFLGRYLTQAALSRNHQVTLFNRGQTNPELFPEVERLLGNRDGDLRSLNGRKWDAVIDTSGFASEKVRASAKLLADSVGHYTFISSISVYRNFAKLGLDESDPVEQLADNVSEDEEHADTYGARKALCEQAAENVMPSRVLSIRAGMIVGPHDGSGRFLYWVKRTASSGELLAPGHPRARVQLIDVRDLAEWIIKMAELRNIGIYNATGPASALTFHQMLEQCRVASGSDVRMTWVDDQFLLEHGVRPFSDLPFWLPLETHNGFFRIDCRRAQVSGLVCRPLIGTVTDTLKWGRVAGAAGQSGLELKQEQELLKTWKNKIAHEHWKNEASTT